MEEFHRLVRPGGRVRIETPHYTDFSSFCDPTHKHHLNSFSFRYFGENHGGFGYYTEAKFREISVRVKLLAFWRWLGFEFLVNRFPALPEVLGVSIFATWCAARRWSSSLNPLAPVVPDRRRPALPQSTVTPGGAARIWPIGICARRDLSWWRATGGLRRAAARSTSWHGRAKAGVRRGEDARSAGSGARRNATSMRTRCMLSQTGGARLRSARRTRMSRAFDSTRSR